MEDRRSEISLVGYVDPWNARPGGRVRLMLSDPERAPGRVDLVRLTAHGAPPRAIWEESAVEGVPPLPYRGEPQPLHPGSCAVAPAAGFLAELRSFTLRIAVSPSLPGLRPQALVGSWCEATQSGFGLHLDADGRAAVRVGDGGRVASCAAPVPLRRGEWVALVASYDGARGRLALGLEPLGTQTPGWLPRSARVCRDAPPGLLPAGPAELRFAAWREGVGARGGHFDGRLEAPALARRPDAQAFEARWDFSRGIDTDRIQDVGVAGLHGVLVNCPTRAVPGSAWTGAEHDWTRAPEQWGALHFHSDDLADAGWSPTVELRLPDALPSGIYMLRATSDDGRCERFPLFVAPAPGAPRADALFLVPTASYLAYANHRLHVTFPFLSGSEELPFQRYLLAHPEVGPDTYGFHSDASGCMYTSRLRPILNVRPDGEGWAFSADLALTGFLARHGLSYEVATDEDLHTEGRALLDGYRVLITGTHPEYWSTDMLEALEAWQRDGGRLVYLGGNGFYWRVAFSSHFPGTMEVRRVGPSTRAWPAEPGEGHHSFTGELGGLWRNLGRPPNRLAGVGFAAQGAGGAAYHRTPASRDPRAAWIFEGVESQDAFGAHGRLGAAADEEIDRFDVALGSPPHALVLASSRGHGPGMLRVIEEFLVTLPSLPDPDVRADLVFYETPSGGAVFSTGSIAWVSALAHRDYANDVARITANVVRRFADPKPFPVPASAPEALALRPPVYFPDAEALRPLLAPEAGASEGDDAG